MVQLTFGNPGILWFLFSLPLLWVLHFYWLRHTKRRAMKFANFQVLKRITGKHLITKNYTILFLRTFILLFAILAAAQTAFWYTGEKNDNSFVLAIDTSASMRAADISPTRLDAAKQYAELFVDSTNSETKFGLLSFSGVAFIEQALTSDKGLVQERIRTIRTVNAGGTDIPGALITSTNLLSGVEEGKVVVLMSDGSNTLETFTGDGVRQGITYAQEQQVTVHTIGLGTSSGQAGYLPAYYNVSSLYNDENLRHIANQTGGQYFDVNSRESLSEAFSVLTARSSEALLKLDLTPWLTLGILLLFFVEWGLLNTRFRALP